MVAIVTTKPLIKIGMSACFFHPDFTRPIFKGKTLLYFEESMAKMVMSYGAIPLLLPRRSNEIYTKDILKQVDALLLQGGSDLSPLSYHEKPIKKDWEGDKERDDYEIELVREAISANKPVLGICRGLQLINVALGGSLYQDIPSQLNSPVKHRDWEVYDDLKHEIVLSPSRSLEKMYKNIPQRKIISVHHQAIKDTGEGLTIEARSKEDGIIEAVRFDSDKNGGPFVMGIQWHPEYQRPDDLSLMTPQPIINKFLDSAVKSIRI